jgi:predicted nucleic acid-binding protein
MARRSRGRAAEAAPRYRVPAPVPVVVDASIAIQWFAAEPDRGDSIALLESDSRLLAPEFMAIEVANGWWKKARRGEMDGTDIDQAVTNLLAMEIAWIPAADLVRSAIRLARDLGHPVSDCVYLVLAASRAAKLATADVRLRGGAARVGVPLWSARPSR